MRSRELWLWLGAAFLTVATVSAAIAIAYFTKYEHFSLMTSPQMLAAIVIFLLAFVCFLAAIYGWPFPPRRLKFPDLLVTVGSPISEDVSFTPIPGLVAMGYAQRPNVERIFAWEVHFTNREQERTANIKSIRVRIKIRGEQGPATLTSGPPRLNYESSAIGPPVRAFDIEPGGTKDTQLVFHVLVPEFVDLPQSWIELEDAQTGLLGRFPTARGTYDTKHGLQVLRSEQRDNVPYAAP
jgi:hypothetical protein